MLSSWLDTTGVKLLANSKNIPMASEPTAAITWLSVKAEIKMPMAHSAAPSSSSPRKFPANTATSGTRKAHITRK